MKLFLIFVLFASLPVMASTKDKEMLALPKLGHSHEEIMRLPNVEAQRGKNGKTVYKISRGDLNIRCEVYADNKCHYMTIWNKSEKWTPEDFKAYFMENFPDKKALWPKTLISKSISEQGIVARYKPHCLSFIAVEKISEQKITSQNLGIDESDIKLGSAE